VRVSQSESNKNILVMLDVDGVLLDRCNKQLLATCLYQVLKMYLSGIPADDSGRFNKASFRAIFQRLFSENDMWHKVFYLDGHCSKGEFDIATKFLIVVRDRMFAFLGEVPARESQPDLVAYFVNTFLKSQLKDIMLDHSSVWSFVTTPLIKEQLQDALEKYSVCFVTMAKIIYGQTLINYLAV
jgi:hypothetical protein